MRFFSGSSFFFLDKYEYDRITKEWFLHLLKLETPQIGSHSLKLLDIKYSIYTILRWKENSEEHEREFSFPKGFYCLVIDISSGVILSNLDHQGFTKYLSSLKKKETIVFSIWWALVVIWGPKWICVALCVTSVCNNCTVKSWKNIFPTLEK